MPLTFCKSTSLEKSEITYQLRQISCLWRRIFLVQMAASDSKRTVPQYLMLTVTRIHKGSGKRPPQTTVVNHPVHQRALLSCLLHPAKCSGRLLNQGACSGRFLVACNSLSYCLCNLHFLPLLCCLSGGSDCLTSLITLLGLTALCVSLCVFVCVQVQLLCLFCNDGSRG